MHDGKWKVFLKQWSVEICSVFEKSKKMRIQRRDLNNRHCLEFTPMSKFTQHISYWTCNLVLYRAIWGTQASFRLFWMVGKSKCITTGTSTNLSVYCISQNFHSFWTLYINWKNLSLHHTLQCTEFVAPRQFSAHPFEPHYVQNNHRFSVRVHLSLPHFIISC